MQSIVEQLAGVPDRFVVLRDNRDLGKADVVKLDLASEIAQAKLRAAFRHKQFMENACRKSQPLLRRR